MKIVPPELRALLCDLAPIAKKKFDELIAREDAFDTVGMGADNAPTTKIDRNLESLCIEYLASTGMVASVLSEEAGETVLFSPGLQAVLDPLDGTTNAKMGFPYYALSVALLQDGEALAGLVFNYASEDIFLGVKDSGAWRNGRRINVADPHPVQQACVVSSRPLSDEEVPMYGQMMRDVKRLRISSSPALDIAHVACGTFDAYVDYHRAGLIHTHDVIAAKLILEEAGGSLWGETGPLVLPMTAHETFNVFAVSDQKLYRHLRAYFHA